MVSGQILNQSGKRVKSPLWAVRMALSTSGGHGSHSAWFLNCLYLWFLLDISKLPKKRTKKNDHMLILNLSTFFFFFFLKLLIAQSELWEQVLNDCLVRKSAWEERKEALPAAGMRGGKVGIWCNSRTGRGNFPMLHISQTARDVLCANAAYGVLFHVWKCLRKGGKWTMRVKE